MPDSEFRPSLNEVSALAKKAVRGAGMSWGIAEEAASSVRWLSSRMLPGPELLAGLLSKRETFDVTGLSQDIATQPWKSTGRYVCPLLAAAAFSDNAWRWEDPSHNTFEIVELAYPVLMLPTVAKVSAAMGTWLQMSWDNAVVTTDGKTTCMQGTFDSLTVNSTRQWRCAQTQDMVTIDHSSERRSVDKGSWKLLETYAHLTYAPDTEESRRLGAGADS